MKINKEKIDKIMKALDIFTWIIVIFFIITILIFACKSFYIAWNLYHSNISIKDTDWVVLQTFTGELEDNNEISIDINNPRDILNYQMEYWTWWIDYIVASPINQPKLDSKNASENTKKMHQYLYQNRLNFEIKDKTREGYIMFITTFPVKDTNNIFLWLDWKTIWWLNKEQKLKTENDNEFLYSLKNIELIWNNQYKFSEDLSDKTTISINAIVWEYWNYIEKIIIFFK